LPGEAEVTETYNFAPDLPQLSTALAAFVQQGCVEPLMRELQASDEYLIRGLQEHGMNLSFHLPRSQVSGFFGGQPAVRELSIFAKDLPAPLCTYPDAVNLWAQRQRLEGFLHHPHFDRTTSRQHVVERLREWHQRGLANGMRMYGSGQNELMPSDPHVLENLVMRMLEDTFPDFLRLYMSSDGRFPPLLSGQQGQQPPAAWIRQVTQQHGSSSTAATRFIGRAALPPPHYEVVTPLRTWRLRAGNLNLLEALALLMKILKTNNSAAFSAFPMQLRAAVEKGGGIFQGGSSASAQPHTVHSRVPYGFSF